MRNWAIITGLAFLTACGGQSKTSTPAPEEVKEVEAPAAQKKEEEKAAAVPEKPKGMAPLGLPDGAGDALLDPTKATATAPDLYEVKFVTSAGDFVMKVHRDWSPNGADRFYNLVSNKYYDGVVFFRVIDGFMAQVGIHGDPSVNNVWRQARIQDDPVVESNKRGFVSFATGGPNTRTTQFFINFGNNANLDGMGFSPFAEVTEGMDVVDSLYKGYGEGAPRGRGPNQGLIQSQGNAYLNEKYPELSFVKTARVIQ